MPRNPESRELARAIRRQGIGLVAAHGQKITKGIVRRSAPLAVELMANDIVIEDEHLLLGAMMRWYDKKVGFAVGDVVLVTCLDDGDWFVIDVVTLNDLTGLG